VLISALSQLKNRLQQHYEQAYPDLGDIIRYVIDEEEANAWNLSSLFPHLVLPDLVEIQIAQLGLQPLSYRSDNVLMPRAFVATQENPTRAVGQFL
jgi:hypothetical protein